MISWKDQLRPSEMKNVASYIPPARYQSSGAKAHRVMSGRKNPLLQHQLLLTLLQPNKIPIPGWRFFSSLVAFNLSNKKVNYDNRKRNHRRFYLRN